MKSSRSPEHETADDLVDEVELMGSVRRGDVDAFARVMDLYWERTFLYARHLLNDADHAYDVAQEAFARLWERRREWEPSGSVGGWLLRTARNLVIMEQRKIRVRRNLSAMAAEETEPRQRTPLQHAESEELGAAIRQAVQELSPRRREVFTLFHLHHLSYREIGEMLDIRPRTIANTLQAAVAELRQALQPFFAAAGRSTPPERDSHRPNGR